MNVRDLDPAAISETCALGLLGLIAIFAVIYIIGIIWDFIEDTWWAGEVWRWVVMIVLVFAGIALALAGIGWMLWCVGGAMEWMFGL